MGWMNALRPADLAARVVAWHNRHPLARRITSAQVGGIGVVSLPFALPEAAADGAVPAMPALRPIFTADWMYGAMPARLDRFASTHGAYPLEAAQHWPWRHVDAQLDRSHAADAEGLTGRTARHLLSAVIDVDGRRVRVLVAPAADLSQAPVFGRRLLSLPRLGGASAAGSAVIAGALVALVVPGDPGSTTDAPATTDLHAAVETRAAEPAPAASGTVMAAAAESASAPADHGDTAVAVAHSGSPPADEATAPVITATEVVRPADVAPMLQDAQAAGPLVRIRPTLTEDERRTARLQAEALRPATAPEPAASMPSGPVFALASPAMRTRDDAVAQQVLLQSLKAQVATPTPTHLDVMAAGKRWRVVWWPHPRQDDAERLRLEARARGLKLELIAF
jgi:hypothetical protein